MSKFFTFPPLAATVLSIPVTLVMGSAALADKQGFQVQNNTSVDLNYLYITESSVDNWGTDVLGRDEVLAPGYYKDIIFNNPDPDVCIYDFRGEFADGDVVEELRFNVCTNGAFQFYEYYE